MALDKRYSFIEVEKGKYENWKNKGYFTAGDKSKAKFSVVIPPPNVTGKLHIGHTLDNTIQDIACRYKKSKGFDVLFLPGCDHAGIATQAKVDKRLQEQGTDRFKIGREEFLKQAFKWKDEYAAIIHSQWAKTGIMLDYTRERFTLDEGFSYAVYEVFKKLYDEGLIYRGERIVNYDTKMKTALSNIEVVYEEEKGSFYYFKYPFVDNKDKFITIATTRPETMFGDVCVCVNPKDERFKDVIGKKVINPANGDELPIIADEYVDIEFGTGAMKCTPAHDPNDAIIGKKYNLEHPIIMNIDGTMAENTGKYAGMTKEDCREALVEDIKQNGNLIKIEEIIHKVGHSERSGVIVEPILSKQWFVKMKPLAEAVLRQQESENRAEFFPSRFSKVLDRWMNECEDWCISRQLWWGHRIPVFYNKNTNEILVSDKAPKDIENWYQDEDVLDTWFSSALWPFGTMGWPDEYSEDYKRYYPTDLMVTGYDIIFFWVARMYFQGLHFTNKTPFKHVLIHGLVRDSKGRKMSKSLGNGIDPFDVIDKFGVDSLRYFLATTSAPGLDMRFIEEKVNSCSNYLNKIWNSARYILMNIPESYNENDVDLNKLEPIDKFILTKLENTIDSVTKSMESYEYGIASTNLYNFVYDDFCSFYLEMTKVNLNGESYYKEGTYFALLKVLKSIVMMIYPFSPFITEEIYLNLPTHKESIMLEDYPIYEKQFIFANEKDDGELLQKIIEDIRSYKVNNSLAPNASIKISYKSNKDYSFLVDYIKRFCFASDVIKTNEDISNATSLIYKDIILYIEDNIDKKDLKEKLEKELVLIESEIKRCETMFANKNFMDKAPEQKIAIEKEKYNNHLNKKEEILKKFKNL